MEPILLIDDDGPLQGSIVHWRTWRAKMEKLGKDRDADVDYQLQHGDSVNALLQMLELRLCNAPPLAPLEARRAELYQGGQTRLSHPVPPRRGWPMIRCQLSGELLGDEEGIFTFIYDGVTYRPTDNFQALGILLFGLQPKGFEFHCKTDFRPCQQAMLAAGMEFHKYANGDKWLEDGTRRFTPERLIEWIDAAADLAPTLEAKQDVIKAVMRSLGPFALDHETDKPVNRS